jgi:hypothetical protein
VLAPTQGKALLEESMSGNNGERGGNRHGGHIAYIT